MNSTKDSSSKKASLSSSYHHQDTAYGAASYARRKALADALAGVVASLVALWTFYPIDVIKTNLQGTGSFSFSSLSNKTLEEDSNNKSVTTSSRLTWSTFKSLFRGLPAKTVHAATSSFCYFYIYSWIVTYWTQKQQQRRNQSGNNNNNKKDSQKLSAGTHLLLSAVAAMMNVVVTLPLDVISSNQQTQKPSEKPTSAISKEAATNCSIDKKKSKSNKRGGDDVIKMDRVWKDLLRMESSMSTTTNASSTTETFYDTAESHYTDDLVAPETSIMWDNDNNNNNRRRCKEDEEDNEEKKDEEFTQSGNGLVLKQREQFEHFKQMQLQQQRQKQQEQQQQQEDEDFAKSPLNEEEEEEDYESAARKTLLSKRKKFQSLWKGLLPSLLLCSNPAINYTVFDMMKNYISTSSLSLMESFMLGLVAKFVATIATYPLIRVKVMLMVTSGKTANPNNMLQLLYSIYKKDGIMKGLYKGCNVQLLHTVLKSALLMMVKEKIALTTSSILLDHHQYNQSNSKR